jgi:hypothetical protein
MGYIKMHTKFDEKILWERMARETEKKLWSAYV